jgi:diguanylate cyclase (GGDEF)-like protein
MTSYLNEFERRQYHDQANIVYLSSIFAMIALMPIIISFGNIIMIIGFSLGASASFTAYLLNRKSRYGLAAAVFIAVISLQAALEIVMFERYAGFAFYYFNLAGLIIFTNWKGIVKITSIVLMSLLFFSAMLIAMNIPPYIPLSREWVIFFLFINIAFNITGVANSAHYYVRIARHAHHQLERAAFTDFLTRLPNRIAFDQFINSEKLYEQHRSTGLGILMIDVDHFKKINDTYGHLFGDQVLQTISSIISVGVGSDEMVARYGGEEFAVLLPETNLQTAKNIAERLRINVANKSFEVPCMELNITISIGVAWMPGKIASIETLIERADEAMYQAKRSGRNMVCVFNEI